MKRTIILVALMITTSVPVPGQTSAVKTDKNERAKKEVIALAREYADALVKRDVAAAERILSEDYVEIWVEGGFSGKTLAIRGLREKLPAVMPPLEAIDFDEILTTVRVYDNTAVLFTRITFKFKRSKVELSKWWSLPTNEDGYWVTLVAVKKGGNWQIVSQHGSVFGMKGQESKQ